MNRDYLARITMKQQLLPKLISTTSVLVLTCLTLACTRSYAKVPKTAYITQPANLDLGIKIYSRSNSNSRNTPSLGSELTYYNGLSVPPDGSYATLRFKDSNNVDLKLKFNAVAHNSGTTRYLMPCKAVTSGGSNFVVTWEDGKGSGCGKGLKVTSKDSSYSSQRPFSQIVAVTQKNKSILEPNFDPKIWKEKSDLKAQLGDSDTRHYCSALPNAGGGSAGMSAGFSSMEEACNNATQKCLKNNNDRECSIETVGEWSINDPELMTSVTCENGKSSRKRVRGSDISDPSSSTNAILNDLLKQLLGDLGGILSGLLNLKPGTCVLEVYHPDEVVISPTQNQQTVVQATDVGNGIVQVDVQEGQALIRSTQSPTGMVANQGESYLFNGEGAIRQGQGRRQPTYTPTPYPSPSPTP